MLKHGHASRTRGLSPAYKTWRQMLRRCYDMNAVNYDRYGKRGVTVCERWRGPEGFANFLADMGERPEGLTLDRCKGTLEYGPGNCRWANATEQSRNRRSVKLDTMKVRQLRLLAEMGYAGHHIDRMFGLSRGRAGQILRGNGWQ